MSQIIESPGHIKTTLSGLIIQSFDLCSHLRLPRMVMQARYGLEAGSCLWVSPEPLVGCLEELLDGPFSSNIGVT